MIRITELAIILKISPYTLLSYLQSVGGVYKGIHRKVLPHHELLAREYFNFINQDGNDYFQGFYKNEINRHRRRISFDGVTIESYFNDNEVKNLCLKANDSQTRQKARSFSPYGRTSRDEYLRFELHQKANEALELYGGYLITFILKLDFVQPGANFEHINLTPSNSFFPDFHFVSGEELFKIRFLSNADDDYNEKGFVVLDKKNQPYCRANYRGKILNKYYSIPRISFNIFIGYINGVFKVNSGGTYTHCDVCGKELIDPISINIGRGPVCREGNKNKNCFVTKVIRQRKRRRII